MNDSTAIHRAVSEVGGQAALASAIGVKPAVVWQWLNDVRPVPAHHCIPIETATGGKVTRHELREDVFGPAPARADKRRKAA